MHKLHDLKDMLCEELEEYGSKDKLDVGALEIVDKLAHAIKNIDKIIETKEMETDGGASNTYPYYRHMPYSYRDGSYAGRRRDSMGRYSRADDDMHSMIAELRDMMPDLSQEKQREVKRFIEKIEQM